MDNVDSECELKQLGEKISDPIEEAKKEDRENFVYDFFYNQFQDEFQRNRHIENKATGVLQFAGALFAFISATGLSLLKEVMFVPLFCISYILYLVSLLFLGACVFSGIAVLYLKVWRGLNFNNFMEEYVKKEKTKEEMLPKLIAEYADACSNNAIIVQKKTRYLKVTFYSFALAIITIFFFIMSISIQFMIVS